MERFATHDGIQLAYYEMGDPGGRAVVVAGDHLTAVADPGLAAAMVGFLDEHTGN